ncbi:SDR family NAD(P)-dependent oxidoreductase [Paraburkholderia sediminicola]|uniref:SDR family NAD(P)-dependent oxidoreductase n=1 Tax=Paraburkholderia sediminicola TaxID=458836 RepID=UPI0038BC38F1
MDLGLTGKRALVLSSSRGLGRGVAESLASEGADVAMTAHRTEQLCDAVSDVNAKGRGRAHPVTGDRVRDAEAIYRETYETLGQVGETPQHALVHACRRFASAEGRLRTLCRDFIQILSPVNPLKGRVSLATSTHPIRMTLSGSMPRVPWRT